MRKIIRTAAYWTAGIFFLLACGCTPAGGASGTPGPAGSTAQTDSTGPEKNISQEEMDLNIVIDRPIGAEATLIDAASYGMDPAKEDNNAALSAAIKACREKMPATLVIPKGTYRFASGRYLELTALRDVVVDGQGSEFIFSGTGYFRVINSTRVVIKDLTLDWDWDRVRIADLFKVRAAAEDGSYFDLEFTEIDNADPDMVWETINRFDPDTLTPGLEGSQEYWKDSLTFDKVEKLESNVLRIFPRSRLNFKKDEVYLVRHISCLAHAFETISSTHVTYEDITNYSSPGIGFVVSGESSYVQLLRCTIGLRPDTNRRISTQADGFHVESSKGYIRIEDCDFSFMGDDAVNIHDNVGIVTDRIDGGLTVCTSLNPKPGDVIEIRNPDLSLTGFRSEVVSVEPTGGKFLVEVRLKDNVPDTIGAACVVVNTKYSSGYFVIKNNYFHENRARALLLQASNGLVEGNRFYKTQGPAIMITTDINMTHWQEGLGAENIIIRDNVIEACSVSDWGPVVQLAGTLPGGLPDRTIFNNIRIENNRFTDFPSEAFLLQSCGGIAITGNTFENPSSTLFNKASRGGIRVNKAGTITIKGNEWIPSPYMEKPGELYVMNMETDSIVMEDNVIPK